MAFRPFRAVPLRRRSGKVIPFRKPRRRRGRGRRVDLIMVAAPLAAFSAVFVWGFRPAEGLIPQGARPAALADTESGLFGRCAGRTGWTCVIDGDSLRYRGEQIRIADIDAPELGKPRCPEERALGEEAEDRLLELLNEGPFTLEPADRATDRYGRSLYVLTRDGESLGDRLVAEGLAQEWQGRKAEWC